MPRHIRVVCPLTGSKYNLTEGATLQASPVDPEESIDLPPGWGRLIVQQVVPNPDHAATLARREATRAPLMAQIAAAAKEGGGSEQEMALAERMVDNNLDQQFPLPDEELTVEHVVGDISPEGMVHLFGALKQLGLDALPYVGEGPETTDVVNGPPA